MTNRSPLVLVNGIWREIASSDTILGNISGSAATVTGANQSSITQVGTLVPGTIISAGAGTGTGSPAITVNTQYTVVSSVNTAETDLMTYTLPASSLSAGKAVRIFAWGTGVNNINVKTVNTYIGGTLINTDSLLASAAGVWRAEVIFISSGSNTQVYFADLIRLSATSTDVSTRVQGTGGKTDTAGIIFKFTGTGVTSGDVTQNGMIVQFLN